MTEQKYTGKYEDYLLTVTVGTNDTTSDASNDTADTSNAENIQSYTVNITFNERNAKSPHAQELHSTVMTISQGDTIHLKLFKPQQYFKNNIEIFINDDTCAFTDDQSVALSVWFDYILKNIGIAYRE